TYASQMGEFAEVLEQKNKIFMINPRWVTIICGNQVNLLKAFILCWRAFAPDIQVVFNDSDYDWHFIMKRAYHLNILEWMWKRMTGKFKTKEEILKWKYRGKIGAKSENNFMIKGKKKDTDEKGTIWRSGEEVEEKKDYMEAIKIKITTEEDFFSSFLKLPGCVPIDCGLDTKANMPYDEMWRIYSETKKDPSPLTARKMREVANYYIIDALRCQELLVKLSQINDYREVASIAHVSLFDSHYRANGMKVRNLLDAYAFKRDIVFSSRVCENIEKGKYPDAYVFPPEKGIEMRRPVTGLDFASLYP
ncbi:17653_t:CDS:2, partial [Funneliformis geosporum]